MGFGSNQLKGVNKMIKTLNTTKDKTAKKVARAGANSSLMALAKGIRAAVNASPASPEIKKAARKTVGKKLRRYRGGGGSIGGKAGFGVGKPSKKKQEAASARAGSGHGVGISSNNIHWFVLGTEERYQKSGKATGEIDDYLKGVVPSASMASRGAMLEAARKKCTQVLARETAKARK